MESGKFVLRIPPDLHALLKREAREHGASLNQTILRKLLGSSEADPYDPVKQVFKTDLLGIILFGSYVRGENRKSSDLDLLIVLQKQVPIERGLYRVWEKKIENRIQKNVSPQFSHVPEDLNNCSSLWLEVALEGEIVFDPTGQIRRTLHQIKSLIASGAKVRKLSHGHPYWISRKAEDE